MNGNGGIDRRTLLSASALTMGATVVTPRAWAVGPGSSPDAGTSAAGSSEQASAGRELGDLIGRHPDTVLRPGSARQAGLLPQHLNAMRQGLRGYLRPAPEHPYYPGYVVLAARRDVIAVHEAEGRAVRYRRYDEETDTGVEFPPAEQRDAELDTLWDLASCTKLFTSLVAVRELEHGRLALDGKAADYLPEYGRAGKQNITIRQLLTHTSGLQPDLPFYDEPDERARRALLYGEAPQHTPGSTYQYSDLNLITLQWVLEKVAGASLDTLVHRYVTGPLRLRDTLFNPPRSLRHRIAAQEDQRTPWARVDRGLVWGEVHDENAWAFGGVSGHAGLFSTAHDLAVLGRTLLNGGRYGEARILSQASVESLFTNFNSAFPGDEHGLGFELYQYWYMGSLATPYTAGHTGFTGTSLVLDPTTESMLVLLSNSVHPNRQWRSGSGPRYTAGTHLARACPVRPPSPQAAWYSGGTGQGTATLELPRLTVHERAQLTFRLWWDTEPDADRCTLQASVDGAAFRPVPFRVGRGDRHADGVVEGWGERRWHRAVAALDEVADLTGSGGEVRLRWKYDTDQRYGGRGVYLHGVEVRDGKRLVFSDRRHKDADRIVTEGWHRSTN